MSKSGRKARAVSVGLAMLVLGGLFVLAPYFAGDVDFMGLSDEAIHTIAHLFVWSFVTLMLVWGSGRRYRLAWLVVLALAGFEEWHQGFVPGRMVDIMDWLLNFVAASVTVLTVAGIDQVRAWARASRTSGRGVAGIHPVHEPFVLSRMSAEVG